MEQTIEQAATALGKSVRQVRYLIKTGKLRARKIGASWVVESADLPRSPEQLEVAAQKVQRLREVVDDALDPTRLLFPRLHDQQTRNLSTIPASPPSSSATA